MPARPLPITTIMKNDEQQEPQKPQKEQEQEQGEHPPSPPPPLPLPLPVCSVDCSDLATFDRLHEMDIVYMASTVFENSVMVAFTARAAAELRPNSRVITLHEPLKHEAFETEAVIKCVNSWGDEDAFINVKRPAAGASDATSSAKPKAVLAPEAAKGALVQGQHGDGEDADGSLALIVRERASDGRTFFAWRVPAAAGVR